DHLLHSAGIDAGVKQRDGRAQRMPDQANREPLYDIRQTGEVQDMLGDTIERTRRPSAVSVAPQVECVNVIVLAQHASHVIPVARVIQAAVNQNHNRFALSPPVPELKLQTVRVEVVRYGFQTVSFDHSTNSQTTPEERYASIS